MSSLNLLGIEGYKGSGKDTACKWLQEMSPIPIKRLAFGDILKQEVHELFSIPMELLHADEETKNSTLTTVTYLDLGLPQTTRRSRLTVREVLQFWGTDIRRSQDPDYWVNQLRPVIQDYYHNNPDDVIVITDVRFANEVKMILELNGLLVRMTGKALNEDTHESENQELYFDYEVPGKGNASKSRTKSMLCDVMWSAFGICCDRSHKDDKENEREILG